MLILWIPYDGKILTGLIFGIYLLTPAKMKITHLESITDFSQP